MTMIFHDSQIIRLDSVDSTNSYALSLIGQNNNEPFVVLASEQTKGRGQQGNKWHTQKDKNLIFSIVVYPHVIKANEQFILNKAVALSVKIFIEEKLNKKLLIKWPNDIYIDNKKIAGILIEHAVMNDRLLYSIIGIGINVNQTFFPLDIPNPVSMKLISGLEFDLIELLHSFLETFNHFYLKLDNREIDILNNQYLNSLFLNGIESSFIYKNKRIKATIKNVDKYGRLILCKKDGKEIICNFKEIQFVL
jgi:BirA family biotin operon repressor/biotin-[acetyl-CoA-carboxylase] ligase